ncbi:MAG: DsrE family protein [Alphaproteobacteria bacterium]
MAKYLLIESRDPYETNDVNYYYDLAKGLAGQGDDVTLFLVQNGVLSARVKARSGGLVDVAKSGVQVLADDFSLRERAITEDQLVSGVKPAPLDTVIDRLAEGAKTIWH